MFYYFILILITFIIFLTYIVIRIFRQRKKYTRERFAFYSVAMLSSMATLIIAPLLESESIWTILVKIINCFFKTDIKIEKVDALSQTLAVIIFTIFTILIHKIHKNWDGGISIRQSEEERLNEKGGIIKDTFEQVIFKFQKSEKLNLYNPDEKRENQVLLRNIPETKLVWNIHVAELLMLSSTQYKIDINQDWYSEYSCYISKYGKTQEVIAIYCSENEPENHEIDKFIEFVESQTPKYFKLIVVIKNGDNKMESKKYKKHVMEYRYEQEILANLIDFSHYYKNIINEFESEIIKGCNLSLKDVYVNAECTGTEKLEVNNIDDYIKEWLNYDYTKKHIAIMGEYGQGKSVYTLHLVYEIIKKKIITDRIPILIVLRGKSPRNLNTLEIISNWAGEYGINPKAVLKLHRLGKLLLIFDGFDEMDLVGDEEMRLAHFQRLWEFAGSNSKIIITGRPNFFLDTKELEIALGTKPDLKDIPYCETLYLKLFSKKQIEGSLRNIDQEVRDEIMSIVKAKDDNKNFCDLIRRPATLFLVTQIWKSSKLNSLKEKINSALVIQEFIKSTYSRQHEKNNHIKYTKLNVNEREYFMVGIAMGMYVSSSNSNQISKERLKNLVNKLYENFPDEISKINTTFVHNDTNSLKERTKNLPPTDDTILTDVRSCGILVNDLSHIDHFKFAHKSFFEFLVSQYYSHSVLKNNEKYIMIINSINKSLDISMPAIYDREILDFTAQSIINNTDIQRTGNDEKDCKLIFRRIYKGKFLNRSPKFAGNFYIYYAIVNTLIGLSILISSGVKSSKVHEDPISITLFMGWGILTQVLMFIYTKIRRKIKFSVKIWMGCCKELGIDNKVIDKLTPKYYDVNEILLKGLKVILTKRKKQYDYIELDNINGENNA